MVVVILFRILILIALALIVYTAIQYMRSPERRLQAAKDSEDFFFVDDTDSKKNLQFVHKGCLFEGEKYLGTTEDSFEVVDIHVTVRDPLELKGFTRDDLYFLEKEILIHYPYAKVTWKHPINQLILTEME